MDMPQSLEIGKGDKIKGTFSPGGDLEHDILVAAEDGSRNLTGFPTGPQHNIIKH